MTEQISGCPWPLPPTTALLVTATGMGSRSSWATALPTVAASAAIKMTIFLIGVSKYHEWRRNVREGCCGGDIACERVAPREPRHPGNCYNFQARRYRLGVRTEDSQSSNTGSIPVSATRNFFCTFYIPRQANTEEYPHSPTQAIRNRILDRFPADGLGRDQTGGWR